MACCGDLIKNYEGQWLVGFAKPIAVASSIVAKLWALREGLSLCIEIQAQTVEFEIDATPSISLFSSNIDSNGDLFALVNDCIDLLL